MKIYTKTGDTGSTSLIGNIRVAKNDLRVEAYGTIDELNAYLGLIRTFNLPEDVKNMIFSIQKNLLTISSFIACPSEEIAKKLQAPDENIVEMMEKSIDEIITKLPKSFSFIIPANNTTSAHINIARTICRRTERCVTAINEDFPKREYTMIFLNRLSDYLYSLFRIFDM